MRLQNSAFSIDSLVNSIAGFCVLYSRASWINALLKKKIWSALRIKHKSVHTNINTCIYNIYICFCALICTGIYWTELISFFVYLKQPFNLSFSLFCNNRILRSIYMIISIPSSAIGKALCPRFPFVKEKSDKSNPEVEMGQKRNNMSKISADPPSIQDIKAVYKKFSTKCW